MEYNQTETNQKETRFHIDITYDISSMGGSHSQFFEMSASVVITRFYHKTLLP